MSHSPRSVRDAVIQWLAPNSPYYQQLLKQCQNIELQDGKVILECPWSVIDRVVEDSDELETPSQLRGIHLIELRSPGRPDYKIPVGQPTKILEVDHDNPIPIGIVRMRDHRGIDCSNSIHHACGANRDRWLGEDMSKFHIPAELKRLVGALETHKIIWGFSYQAFDFEGALINCVVNAHLFEADGEWYRCVETTHCLRA